MAKKPRKFELLSQESVEKIPEFYCSICGQHQTGHGHNPEPIYNVQDRCCDFCNMMFVLPARMGVKFDHDDLPFIAEFLKRYDIANLLKWWSVFYNTMTNPAFSSPRQTPDQQ